MHIRPNTSDVSIYSDVYLKNEYNLDYTFTDDDLLIDIGAHVGSFSCLAYDKFNAKNIICFEPDLGNYNNLAFNLQKVPTVILNNKAVWKSTVSNYRLSLSNYEIFNGAPNTAACSAVLNNGNRSVECSSLDDIFFSLTREYNKVILKIDCEGSEYPILFTSSNIQKIDSIYMEVHDLDKIHLSNDFKIDGYSSYNFQSMEAFLVKNGFKLESYKKLHIHMEMQLHLCKFSRA